MTSLKTFFVVLFLYVITISLYSQDINKLVIDEKTGKQMLIGECTLEAFRDTSFAWWWNSGYEMFEPNLVPFENIREELSEIYFIVFMGTWCSDSRQLIPRFFKTLDLLDYPTSIVKIISVDRDKKSNTEGEKVFGITLVPTIIIYKDNNEIGRIVELPVKSLEEDIADIILSNSIE
jgi:thiol-disulfide isomerase/thioredoxin